MSGRYINWGDIGLRYKDAAQATTAEQADQVFIPQAEAEVDARLAPRYATPFAVSTTTDTPQLVRDLCIDIAYWKMYRRADWAEKFREQIDSMFEALTDGTMTLTSSLGSLIVAQTIHTQPGYRSSFGLDNEVNWMTSSAWAEDLASGN